MRAPTAELLSSADHESLLIADTTTIRYSSQLHVIPIRIARILFKRYFKLMAYGEKMGVIVSIYNVIARKLSCR